MSAPERAPERGPERGPERAPARVPMRGEGRTVLGGFVVLALLAAFVVLRFETTTDIAHFLPEGVDDRDVRLARELQQSELPRTMVLLVEAPDTAGALAAGRELEAALRADPAVHDALAFLEGGPPSGLETALVELYRPRALSFLAATPEAARARTSDAGLRRAFEELERRLATSGMDLVLEQVAPSDPWLVLPALFRRLAGGRSGLTVLDGRFVTEDERAAVLFLGTHAAVSDSAVQRPLLAGIRRAFDRIAREQPGLALVASGANRFAVAAEEAVQADVRRVSIGAAVGLTALFLLLFRSLGIVLMTLPILATGFLAGTAACLLAFGRIHGLTLAFGAALVGVSIDFAVHYHCHRTLAPDHGGGAARATLSRLWTGLSVGAATTVLGFCALIVASFPGLRELATFGAVGIAAALFASWTFLPGLSSAAPPTALARGLATWLGRWLQRGRIARLGPSAVVLAVAAVGLPQLEWNDSFADLGRLDPELLREDEAVRARVLRFEQSRLVVATGADDESALASNDAVAEALAAARAAGELESFRNVATLLPSAARQRAVAAVVREDPTAWARVSAALADAGLVPAGFEPFRRALAAEPPAPLGWADLAASAVHPLVRPFRVTLDGQVGFVSFLAGVHDEAAIADRLAEIPDARWIDVRAVFDDAYGVYRQRMTRLLAVGLVAIVALVFVRHRSLWPTLAACLPAMLAAAGTLGIFALVGIPANLLSLVALLMVVSMGVDYGVFLAEADDEASLGATGTAVVVAGLSTLFGFGLLGLSAQPALQTLGLTSGIGVLLCMLLAPAWRSALPPRRVPAGS